MEMEMEMVGIHDTSLMSDEVLQNFTCEICIEPAMLTQKFGHGTNCVHNICFMCIASHIQSKLDENISTIHCPDLYCGKELIPMECRPVIPSSLFVKRSDCLCRSAVSAVTKCYCPYWDCSELILNECNEATTKCVCPGCKRLICYAFRVPWHAGFRCSETSQVMDENDVEFGRLVEKMKWTRCPSCGQSIERLGGGCRVVLCRCRTLYCHHCGSEECTHVRPYQRATTAGAIFCCIMIPLMFCLLCVSIILYSERK